MRQNPRLACCDKRYLKPLRRTIELCSFKFIATYLPIFVVAEVRQRSKQDRALSDEGVHVLRG